jgi:hypothetical protein
LAKPILLACARRADQTGPTPQLPFTAAVNPDAIDVFDTILI